jgi:hypothetical protein
MRLLLDLSHKRRQGVKQRPGRHVAHDVRPSPLAAGGSKLQAWKIGGLNSYYALVHGPSAGDSLRSNMYGV